MAFNKSNPTGGLEEVLEANCGISRFYEIATILADEYKVKFLNQVDDAESLDWHFEYEGNTLILHYCIFNGVILKQNVTNLSKPLNYVSALKKKVSKFFVKQS